MRGVEPPYPDYETGALPLSYIGMAYVHTGYAARLSWRGSSLGPTTCNEAHRTPGQNQSLLVRKGGRSRTCNDWLWRPVLFPLSYTLL